MIGDLCKELGDLLSPCCLRKLIGERNELGVPVPGDDLVGESDLARSVPPISKWYLIGLPRSIDR